MGGAHLPRPVGNELLLPCEPQIEMGNRIVRIESCGTAESVDRVSILPRFVERDALGDFRFPCFVQAGLLLPLSENSSSEEEQRTDEGVAAGHNTAALELILDRYWVTVTRRRPTRSREFSPQVDSPVPPAVVITLPGRQVTSLPACRCRNFQIVNASPSGGSISPANKSRTKML